MLPIVCCLGGVSKNGMPTSTGVWFFKMPLILFHFSHDMRKINKSRSLVLLLCEALGHMWYRAEHILVKPTALGFTLHK